LRQNLNAHFVELFWGHRPRGCLFFRLIVWWGLVGVDRGSSERREAVAVAVEEVDAALSKDATEAFCERFLGVYLGLIYAGAVGQNIQQHWQTLPQVILVRRL
jgi:hypothetical protein